MGARDGAAVEGSGVGAKLVDGAGDGTAVVGIAVDGEGDGSGVGAGDGTAVVGAGDGSGDGRVVGVAVVGEGDGSGVCVGRGDGCELVAAIFARQASASAISESVMSESVTLAASCHGLPTYTLASVAA